MTALRVFVADDEPLALARMRDLLDAVPGVEWIGEAEDGDTAIRRIDDLEPDLAFLDIRMPGASGLDVLRRVTCRPYVVFTTAYDDHAVEAFELQALDYLLKPFGQRRLDAAVERARAAMASRARLSQLERAEVALAPEPYLERLFVRSRGAIFPVRLADVERLEAQDDYVAVWTGDRSHLIRVPLSELETRLDPGRFVRVHRSHIVNLDYVKAFRSYDGGRLQVEMSSGARVLASRARTRMLKELLG